MSVIQEFNGVIASAALETGFVEGALVDALRLQWRSYVPKVFTGQNPELGREERKAKKYLFGPIEAFLCQGQPEVLLEQLKAVGTASELCGRTFKMGEPTYSCRDCGLDPTCVLCVDCFQNSVHKKHRYRMSTSGGGGFCDCGDAEAWRQEPNCELHKKQKKDGQQQDAVSSLPPGMRERAEALFRAVLHYICELLLWRHHDNLPTSLTVTGVDDTYVTMLFNDEVHTYDQVITALQRAIKCTNKAAVDFATTVDREGRSSVMTGKFEPCNYVKEQITKNTTNRLGSSRPLTVHVMHTSVVAHQVFAMRLMPWLQSLASESDGLRAILANTFMQPLYRATESSVELLMKNDTRLWKAARVQAHQLFMSVVLMDQETKKKFAILFTKHYPVVVADFVRDDHDRRVSILACSVQILTNSTMARMLITDYNLLKVILDTFLRECAAITVDERFVFQKQDHRHSFKRAQFCLHDLKYTLVCKPKPEDWTAALRSSFLQGMTSLLQLLKCMQGMDSVKRQLGQHIEFEPEWETAFNLQLKLEDNITMILAWAATDLETLKSTVRLSLDVLDKLTFTGTSYINREIEGLKAMVIDYDVSRQHVSVHVPISRFVAALFPLAAQFHCSPRQLLNMCSDQDPDSLMIQLMEPCLRCLVLVSQVQANMWKRNGYSLLNQVFFYTNVRCRTQMYDKDILMLQVAGSVISDPDQFLICLLHKFGLLQWTKCNYTDPSVGPVEDNIRQTNSLAEEFLTVLLTVLGERYCPGVASVTDSERVEQEVIQLLCLDAKPHSELDKALPEDPYHETGLEAIINKVACFRQAASSQAKGLYELRPEFYSRYNPHFFHYSRAEQGKAEEVQRLRRRTDGLDTALPPPQFPALTPEFAPLRRVLSSKVLLHLVRLTLERAVARHHLACTQTQIDKVLYLLCVGVNEEDQSRHMTSDNAFTFICKLLEPYRLSLGPVEDGPTVTILQRLEILVGHENIVHEGTRDILLWLIKRIYEVGNLDYSRSRLSRSSDTISVAAKEQAHRTQVDRKKKADAAARRRAKLMAKMATMQKSFIQNNNELFEATSSELAPELPRVSSVMDISEDVVTPVCLGPHKSSSSTSTDSLTPSSTCILCQESQGVHGLEKALVIAAFVQRSTVLSKNRVEQSEHKADMSTLYTPSSLCRGIHVSTCGHVMHAECWQSFYDSMILKERRRLLRYRPPQSYDTDKNEYLCPYCKALGNTVLPLLPAVPSLTTPDSASSGVELHFNDWLDGLQKTIKSSLTKKTQQDGEASSLYEFVPHTLTSVTKMMADSVARNFQALFELVRDDPANPRSRFSDSILDMMKKFCTDVHAVGLGVEPNSADPLLPCVLWKVCAYTISTIECLLRDEGRPIFDDLTSRQKDCLTALVRLSASCQWPDRMRQSIQKDCVSLLSALVIDGGPSCPALVRLDCFHHLVGLTLSMPYLYSSSSLLKVPTGDLNDLHTLSLVFAAHVTSVIINNGFHQDDNEYMDIENDEDSIALMATYLQLRRQARVPVDRSLTPWRLKRFIQDACLPYLRGCALFYHHLLEVPAPETLKNGLSAGQEFEELCRYLGLPLQLSRLFRRGHILDNLLDSWCRESADLLSSDQRCSLSRHPQAVNHLVTLPHDYSDIINQGALFTCPNSNGDESRAPTLCLVCGEMLCSQSYCCQTKLGDSSVGSATYHAHTCGAGTGIFLRVRDCQILLLSGTNKGCFYSPPYLDSYGETDQGLRRGNPMYLSEERYQRLNRLWLSHSIAEEIAHYLESNAGMLSIDWNHL